MLGRRFDVDGQFLLADVDRQLDITNAHGRRRIGLVHALDQHHAGVDVGDVVSRDGNVDQLAVAIQRDDLRFDHAVALNGDQRVDRAAEGAGHEDARCVARCILGLVGDQLNAVVVLAPPGDKLAGPVAIAAGPDIGDAADLVAVLVAAACLDLILAAPLRRPDDLGETVAAGGHRRCVDRRALDVVAPVIGAVGSTLVDAVPDELIDRHIQFRAGIGRVVGRAQRFQRDHIDDAFVADLHNIGPRAEADIEVRSVDRHGGFFIDKLVGRTLDGGVEAPVLAGLTVAEIGGHFNHKTALVVGCAGPFLDQTAVVGVAIGIEVEVVLIVGRES